ncbi:hypothetical protein HYPSUDRAFT_36131 [Hypholoma sublateritium FD-334 SS-4]|uniref:Uncharacterized protein n=1 Tax=Hypholoma sublateritium (strain FD-334 SS-4) TaxID=945553 RepID=A0A0D2Q5U9_HYPSF|nr:hypothetical protein HYPSUDRAFT_36131 [Hypholoma sublateritium FD-334 SS-4]
MWSPQRTQSHESERAIVGANPQHSPLNPPEIWEAGEVPRSATTEAYPNQLHWCGSADNMRSTDPAASIRPMMETSHGREEDGGEEDWDVQDHISRHALCESVFSVEPFDSPSPLASLNHDFGVFGDSEIKWQVICQAREAKLERERALDALEASNAEVAFRPQGREYEVQEHASIWQQFQYQQGDTIQHAGNVVGHSTNFLQSDNIDPLEVRDREGHIERIRARELVIHEKEEEIRLKKHELQVKEWDMERQTEYGRRLVEELAKKESELAKKELELARKESELARKKKGGIKSGGVC